MAKYKLAYLPPAETDILEIVEFHAGEVGPVSARKIYHSIREQIARLQDFPLLGPPHPDPELAALSYRKLALTKTYVAIYRVVADTVTIYRIVNGKTDYPKLLK